MMKMVTVVMLIYRKKIDKDYGHDDNGNDHKENDDNGNDHRENDNDSDSDENTSQK